MRKHEEEQKKIIELEEQNRLLVIEAAYKASEEVG